MDIRGIESVIAHYASLRPFFTLFVGYALGLGAGKVISPGARPIAAAVTAIVAVALFSFAWNQRHGILKLCSLLLVFGFASQVISSIQWERSQDALLAMAGSEGKGREQKVWQVYLEGRFNRALRTRGVFVKGKVLGFTEKGAETSLGGEEVWVHFPGCSGRAGFVAVPTSELECNREGRREVVRLPIIVNLVGPMTRMPPQIVALEEWADRRSAPSVLITAEQWISSKRPEEAERRDLRRKQAEDFLALFGCYEAIREKPDCQMFTVFLGHTFVQLDPEMSARFRRTGLVHLIVPSGAQVTFAILLFLYIAQRVRRLRVLMVLISVALVAWSVGFFGGVPMWRAAGISLIALAGFLLSVEGDFLNQTAAVGLFLLLLMPDWLFDPSFQMSMLASIGMVIGSQMVRGGGLYRATLRAVAGTVGAQLLLFPALASISGIVTPWTALANLIMAPLVSPSLALGYFGFALSVLGWKFGAIAVGVPLKWLLWISLKILVFLSELPVILRENTTITPVYLFFFGIVIFVVSEALYFRTRGKWLGALAVVAALTWSIVPVGVPAAYVYSTGVGTVLYFPQEGLWIGNPYWEEWWTASRRLAVTRTRTGLFFLYPGIPEEPDLSRVAIALSQRHEYLRVLPVECNGRGDRTLGIEYCCYGRQPNCAGTGMTQGWLEAGALVAKIASARPFIIQRVTDGIEVVTDDGVYCISLQGRTDCRGTAIGLADGVVLTGNRLYPVRGLWGIYPEKPPREMPDWWLRGIE